MTTVKSQKGEAVGVKMATSNINVHQPQAYDAALTKLFAKSSGPVQPSSKFAIRPALLTEPFTSGDSYRTTSKVQIRERSNSQRYAINKEDTQSRPIPAKSIATDVDAISATLPTRKRKRRSADDDVEGKYMKQLAKEELKEDERRGQNIIDKRQKSKQVDRQTENASFEGTESGSEPESAEIVSGVKDDDEGDVPRHETMVTSKEDLDLEKSSRTVFLANVSTLAIKSKSAKKTLLDHLASFTSELPKDKFKHGVESLRFRSTAFASTGIPRKAAYAKKELMDTTTRSTNAYAVYTTQLAARESTKRLNGTMILERHLRVDSVAHPAKTDHRRCVFVGNLGFVDDASSMNAAEDEENNKRPRKPKQPADVEEGLWSQFKKAGTVESVRVVRDKTTRVGKGFAYVQFENANAVETALLYNEKKFPPMLPRVLRVTRAKNIKKAAGQREKTTTPRHNGESISSYKPKVPSQTLSLNGRAGKLLGRAGAAQIRASGKRQVPQSKKINGIAKSPETVVFEGFRASRQQGKGTLKMGGSGKKHGKPSARSKDFKAKGRKKG